MEVIQVEGGHRVTGDVRVEGAKNSALKLMAHVSQFTPGLGRTMAGVVAHRVVACQLHLHNRCRVLRVRAA